MLKVTKSGIEVLGRPLKLTMEDRIEILKSFASVAQPSRLTKKNGVWEQTDPSKEYTDAEGILHVG